MSAQSVHQAEAGVGGLNLGAESHRILHMIDGGLDRPRPGGGGQAVVGHPVRVGQRLILQAIRREGPVDKAAVEGLRCRDEPVLQEDLLRLPRPEIPGSGEVLHHPREEAGVLGGEDNIHRRG
ncbi:MAG: hypothetical protein JRE40_08785, partial [Deltaproteobacteria bacterium]|nr:hypothetical protein [Deltaproteobacteria bacterium]